MDINLTHHRDSHRPVQYITATFDETTLATLGKSVYQQAINQIADAITKEFMATRAQEVISKIDPQAVAILAFPLVSREIPTIFAQAGRK